MKKVFFTYFPILAFTLFACGSKENKAVEKQSKLISKDTKIVSLNGTITEILCAAGFEKNIVGTDVTSTYPEKINALPKVGHTQNLQAEGIISLNPAIVFAKKEEIKPELLKQLETAGIKVILSEQEYSVAGTKKLIRHLTDELGVKEIGDKLIEDLTVSIAQIKALKKHPKVLFIYARGVGTLMVAGENTQMESIIELAGAKNAVSGFEDFKPLTPEALVSANPDVILLFSSGLESLEGEKGLTNIPGLSETKAGKNKAFIAMDGQYLAGFGPRLGKATLELNSKIKALNAQK